MKDEGILSENRKNGNVNIYIKKEEKFRQSVNFKEQVYANVG